MAVSDLRIGLGVDAHRFADGIPLVLARRRLSRRAGPRRPLRRRRHRARAHRRDPRRSGQGRHRRALPVGRSAVARRLLDPPAPAQLRGRAHGRLRARERRLRADRRAAEDRGRARRDGRAARGRDGRRDRPRHRAGDDDRRARLHRAAARGSPLRPWRCCERREARPLRRPARPAGDPVRAALDRHVPRVHAPQRARSQVLGPALRGAPGLPARSSSTETSSLPSCTRCRRPGTARSKTCHPAGTTSSPRAYESGREPDALFALAISVLPERQGQRLSSLVLNAMRDAARDAGLRELARRCARR